MIQKAKNLVSEFKYEAVIFLMTVITVLINFDELSGIHHMYVPHYLSDFSMGISSRSLVGSLVSLLNAHPTEEWLTGFATFFLFAGLILTSVVLGRVVKKTPNENRTAVFVFILFFVSGSYTVSMFTRFFGMLDIHLYILMILSVVFAGNKYLRWLVPVLCVAGVLVNYVFVMSYFILVLFAMLYHADRNEKKAGDIAVFVITAVSVLAVTFYCVFEAPDHMFVTVQEALAIMEEKIGHPLTAEEQEFTSIYLFNHHTYAEELFNMPIDEMTPVQFIYYFIQYLYMNRIGLSRLLPLSLITVPVVIMFCIIWVMCIRRTEKKGTKFVFICAMLSFLAIPLCCLLSTDFIRWIGAVIICQFGMCFLLFYFRDEAFDKTVKIIKEKFSKNKLILIIIYFVYVSSAYLDLVA